MRVAIVHYHLKRGGVTRVIESTLRGFDARENSPTCVVLAGEVPENFCYRDRARVVEGLHYSNAQSATPDPRTLLKSMRAAAREALGGEPDLWHIHNHSLGKNSAMPGVVAELAEAGEAVLLQMHDFAEDGRPENYRLNQERPKCAAYLYPNCPHVHYGVINARDAAIFTAAGLPRSTGARSGVAMRRRVPPVPQPAGAQLHLLPNPVEAQSATGSSTPAASILEALRAERLLLYPVRAVRRKNFGEMLLWAALADAGDVFATTLGPTNQNYLPAYQNWQTFAKKHRLPIQFGIGERDDWPFEAIMQSAHAILSTSIAEGFGLAFLEPWLFGKAIIGRDLPAITADFKTHGIQLTQAREQERQAPAWPPGTSDLKPHPAQFEGLYPSLPIPADWIDLDQLRTSITSGLSAAYAAYQRPLPANAVERALAAITPAPHYIDFGGLNEALQKSVIERVLADPAAASALPRMGPLPEASSIQQNADKIAQHYSLAQYAQNLSELYQNICACDNIAATQYLDPAKVLDGFLQPERFRLLRS